MIGVSALSDAAETATRLVSLRTAFTVNDRSPDAFQPTFRMCLSSTSYPEHALRGHFHAFETEKRGRCTSPRLAGRSGGFCMAATRQCDSCLSTSVLFADACSTLQPIEHLTHADFLEKSHEPPNCYTQWAAKE